MASPRTVPENVLLGGLAATVLFALLGISSQRGPADQNHGLNSHLGQSRAEVTTVEGNAQVPATSTSRFDSYSILTCYSLRDNEEIRSTTNSRANVLGRLDRSETFSCRGLTEDKEWVRIESGTFSGGFVSRKSVSGARPPLLAALSLDPLGWQDIARQGTIQNAPQTNAPVLQRISPPQQLHIVGRVSNTDYFETQLRDGSVGYVEARIFEPEVADRRQPEASKSNSALRAEPTSQLTRMPAVRATPSPVLEPASNGITVPASLINRTRMGRLDYPREARRAGQQGTVHFRLNVDGLGRASNCTILSSSGSTVLDNATCSAFVTNARFAPARNGLGENVSSTWDSRIRWSLDD